MIKKILKFVLSRKLYTAVIIFIFIISGYFGYRKISKNKNGVRYITVAAKKDTIISSVSGTGQVSVFNQVDIKVKTSGDVVYVGVKNGQSVSSGTLLIQLDSTEAQKSVRDAQANLDSTKLSLEKLKKPADHLSILQAENALAQSKESKQNAIDDLAKVYEDGFNIVSNTFLDLPSVISGLNDILFSTVSASGQWYIDYYAESAQKYDEKTLQYKNDVYNKYQKARAAYDNNFNDYKTTSRSSETEIIESLIDETYNTTKDIAEAIKSATNLIQFYKDKLTERNMKTISITDTHLSAFNSYTGKTNTHLLNLLSAKNTIQSDKEKIINAERTIAEKIESLAKLKSGADLLDIQSQEIAIKQRENAFLDAKEKLVNYYIRAPFDGVAANVNVKKGDSVSGGAAVITFITKQRIAEISLNEIDVAKVKTGQKVNLTFDAIPDLTITGEVAEIDTIGTASQGVVTYNIKINFDTQDSRVKPGMSVSANVITDIKQDVIVIPNSAIKSDTDTKYVQLLINNKPKNQSVATGISNDTITEIVSGLKEGGKVITQTITANNSSASQSRSRQNSGLRIPGMSGGGFIMR